MPVNFCKSPKISSMSPSGLERTSCRHCITGAKPSCPVHSLLFAGTHVCKQLQSLRFLNTLLPSGMPQHRLNLKVGAPIILIRNLNRDARLMNGTRLSVTSCLRYTIQATVLTGTHKGNSVCIPRVNLTVSDDDDLHIKFIRRQFPVKLAFCMTINKSQGQTFSKVGLLLATRPFSHGQVYVALSRCGNSSAIKVWTAADLQVDANNYGVIENIVWPEILD